MSWGEYEGDERSSRMKQKEYTPVNKETIKEINALPSVAWEERNIRQEIMELFGVKCKLSTEIGPQKIEKVYFPSYDQNDKLVGYKCKDLNKSGDTGEYYTVGKVSVKNKLFGQNQVRKSAKYLIINEGESDMLSVYQSLVDYANKNYDTTYKNLTPAVVSFSCGTTQSVNHLSHNDKFLNNFKEFRIAMDNDSLTDIEKKKKSNDMRGKEATEAIGCYLISTGGFKRKVLVLQHEEWVNDCSDYLQKGYSDILAGKLIFEKNLIPFSAEKIIKVSDIEVDELLKPKEKGVYVDSFPLLMEKMWGIRKRELTVMTAFSGIGKTTVCSEIAYKLAEQTNEKVGLVFLEETSKETLMRMIARRLNKNYYKFVFNPLKYCTKEEFQGAYDWIKGKFFFLDVFGSMKVDELMNSFRSLYYVSECSYIIFDHLSMIASGSDVNDERRLIDNMMTELASFTSQNDIGIFAISHLSRQAQVEVGKISDLKEPKWINCRKEHLKGSSSLEQLSWNVIGMDMLLIPNRERADVRLTILKNRSIGLLGVTDRFHTNDETGLIEIVKDDGNYGY